MSDSLYNNEVVSLSYASKCLLHDSLERTSKAYTLFCDASHATNFFLGTWNLLLSRIESALAFSFIALTSIPAMILSMIFTPCFLVLATTLNVLSQLPGLSYFQSIQQFTVDSADVIYRTIRANIIGVAATFLFLSASAINILPLPGILNVVNFLVDSLNSLIECLGPLLSIRVIVPGNGEFDGTRTEISLLTKAEEYLRALSTNNYLKEETSSFLLYHSTAP
jgi:hypothetical protein